MQLAITDCGDGGQRHVKSIEGGIMIDPYEAESASGEDEHNAATQNDDPVAEAAHAFAILARIQKTEFRIQNEQGYSLRASSTVMSSESSGTPVHSRTRSITLSMICASSRSAFLATNSMRRSSPNISPYSFSGSVMTSV